MDKKLKDFLIATNKAGYAGGESKKWIKEKDGSTTIPFEQGEWKSDDNFFGGEPYGGRTIVFYKGKAVWIMVYYGLVVEEADTNQVYQILRNALIKIPKDYPYRGPKQYKDKGHTYSNSWQGEIDKFSGEEKIFQGKKLIYKANYLGGWVNSRKGV